MFDSLRNLMWLADRSEREKQCRSGRSAETAAESSGLGPADCWAARQKHFTSKDEEPEA
jgi:hypothetical protein